VEIPPHFASPPPKVIRPVPRNVEAGPSQLPDARPREDSSGNDDNSNNNDDKDGDSDDDNNNNNNNSKAKWSARHRKLGRHEWKSGRAGKRRIRSPSLSDEENEESSASRAKPKRRRESRSSGRDDQQSVIVVSDDDSPFDRPVGDLGAAEDTVSPLQAQFERSVSIVGESPTHTPRGPPRLLTPAIATLAARPAAPVAAASMSADPPMVSTPAGHSATSMSPALGLPAASSVAASSSVASSSAAPVASGHGSLNSHMTNLVHELWALESTAERNPEFEAAVRPTINNLRNILMSLWRGEGL
jgi:hypothetical protein